MKRIFFRFTVSSSPAKPTAFTWLHLPFRIYTDIILHYSTFFHFPEHTIERKWNRRHHKAWISRPEKMNKTKLPMNGMCPYSLSSFFFTLFFIHPKQQVISSIDLLGCSCSCCFDCSESCLDYLCCYNLC